MLTEEQKQTAILINPYDVGDMLWAIDSNNTTEVCLHDGGFISIGGTVYKQTIYVAPVNSARLPDWKFMFRIK